MVGVATGFGARGKVPFASTFATFFSRAADQIRVAGISMANLKLAGVTTQRYQDLIKSNSVAQQEVDQNDQNLTSQKAAVVSAAADVKQLEDQQGYEKVTAPFSGVVTERRTDIGDLINAGNSGTGAEQAEVQTGSGRDFDHPAPAPARCCWTRSR